MGNILLTIDWDFFIPIKESWCGSYIENSRYINKIWYRRYLEEKRYGVNISKSVDVAPWTSSFWNKLQKNFVIDENTKLYVSDSHKLCYNIAKENNCKTVYSFDAHSDLGYAGLQSFNFEVNCANWLGKLLNDKIIEKAGIIYSPYTFEDKRDFNDINKKFNIKYINLEDVTSKPHISTIHICRSGAWTPPWLDGKFNNFVEQIDLDYRIINCPKRTWNVKNLNLASIIDCIYC